MFFSSQTLIVDLSSLSQSYLLGNNGVGIELPLLLLLLLLSSCFSLFCCSFLPHAEHRRVSLECWNIFIMSTTPLYDLGGVTEIWDIKL
jgi:hypothetical protein